MATSINTIKNWFKTGMFPTQAQFWAWLDSYRHKDDKVPVADIEGLDELFSPINEHFNDPNAHSELFANFAEINTILEDKGFVKTAESFTPTAGTRWNLKGQVFTNDVSIETPIELCSSGFERIDRVCLDMNKQFVYVIGDEFTENPVPKAKPVNMLDYTFIPVNDTEVGDLTPPILGSNFNKKIYDNFYTYTGTGTDVVIPLPHDGQSNIYLSGSMTSVAGFDFSEFLANPTNAEYPHTGKNFMLTNLSGHDITLLNVVGTLDVFFDLIGGTDVVIPDGKSVFFNVNTNVFVEIDRNWIDTSNKLDKVTTTDVEKVYIKNADGTQGMKAVSELGGDTIIDLYCGLAVDITPTERVSIANHPLAVNINVTKSGSLLTGPFYMATINVIKTSTVKRLVYRFFPDTTIDTVFVLRIYAFKQNKDSTNIYDCRLLLEKTLTSRSIYTVQKYNFVTADFLDSKMIDGEFLAFTMVKLGANSFQMKVQNLTIIY